MFFELGVVEKFKVPAEVSPAHMSFNSCSDGMLSEVTLVGEVIDIIFNINICLKYTYNVQIRFHCAVFTIK